MCDVLGVLWSIVRSARALQVLSHAGLAVRTPTAIAKQQKRSTVQGLPDPPFDSSGAVFIDNCQNQHRRTSRARTGKPLQINMQIASFTFALPVDSPFARVQFEWPLRSHPLRSLSLDDFVLTAQEAQQLRQFLGQKMFAALARVLLEPDVQSRRDRVVSALHSDGLAAKVCANAPCSQFLQRYYNKEKHKCLVTQYVADRDHCLKLCWLEQNCKSKLRKLKSLGLTEDVLLGLQPLALHTEKRHTPKALLMGQPVPLPERLVFHSSIVQTVMVWRKPSKILVRQPTLRRHSEPAFCHSFTQHRATPPWKTFATASASASSETVGSG